MYFLMFKPIKETESIFLSISWGCIVICNIAQVILSVDYLEAHEIIAYNKLIIAFASAGISIQFMTTLYSAIRIVLGYIKKKMK